MRSNKKRTLKLLLVAWVLALSNGLLGQDPELSTQTYFSEQKEFGNPVWGYIFSDFAGFYQNSPEVFESKIDSFRSLYTDHLVVYEGVLTDSLYRHENAAIRLAFDKLLLEYEIHHPIYATEDAELSENTLNYLEENSVYFNDTLYASNRDVQAYISSYVDLHASRLVEGGFIKLKDNKYLVAKWQVVNTIFKNQEIREAYQYKILDDYINNYGTKNLERFVNEFEERARDKENVNAILDKYQKALLGYNDHSKEVYKTVDGSDLQLHLFPPTIKKEQAPTIVYFHGGSWSEGKPDWFFESAKSYASKGWFAIAVEYRIKGRHNTLPFSAVKDAKSAIRWIRSNSEEYDIDPNKIVVTGNSAGGHLALSTILIDTLNEKSDDLNISPFPNAIMVNSAVYDLTVTNSKWIVRDYTNKEIIKIISPNHNLKMVEVPILMIHGEKDGSCLYSSAQYFFQEMKKIGNDIELISIPEANHFIWFGKHAGIVNQAQAEFLFKINFLE